MTKILNETSGVITSPFYPRFHSNNQSCSWEIRARKGKRILFTIEEMYFNWCSGTWSCSCGYLEIQGGSISGYDGPKWRVCHLVATNATYDWFQERIKVLFVSDGQMRWGRRFRISYTQINFSVSGKKILPIACCESENEKNLTFLFLLLFVCLLLTFGQFAYHLGGIKTPFSLCHVLVGD